MTIKKIIIGFCLLFFVGWANAQDAPNITDTLGQKQGHWIKYDENKKKIYDGNFKNNIPIGKFTYFYETGTVKAVNMFSQNGTVVHMKKYNIAGKLAGEGKYINEIRDSLWKFYDDEGKLISVEIYLNGLKNGSCKVYYGNGQVSEDKTFSNGIPDGPCTKYFEDGKVKSKMNYIKDKADGKAVFYFTSGTVYVDGAYKNDLRDGVWKYYNEDGTVNKAVTYKNGQTKDKTEQGIISKEELEKTKKSALSEPTPQEIQK